MPRRHRLKQLRHSRQPAAFLVLIPHPAAAAARFGMPSNTVNDPGPEADDNAEAASDENDGGEENDSDDANDVVEEEPDDSECDDDVPDEEDQDGDEGLHEDEEPLLQKKLVGAAGVRIRQRPPIPAIVYPPSFARVQQLGVVVMAPGLNGGPGT